MYNGRITRRIIRGARAFPRFVSQRARGPTSMRRDGGITVRAGDFLMIPNNKRYRNTRDLCAALHGMRNACFHGIALGENPLVVGGGGAAHLGARSSNQPRSSCVLSTSDYPSAITLETRLIRFQEASSG